ncbi:MAG TPA: 4-hydroxy-tetrahydrodipicolinate reductase [Actinomycetota bacterium]|nr:4-hydroxy-tetrahydrodipicolinate reductase [Actinomycetota bacterium]
MIRVGVLGALGRMGREVCRAIQQDPETVLVAAVDANASGEVIAQGDAGNGAVKVSEEIDMLSQAEVDVAVDFTHPKAVMDNVRWCIRHAVDVVVGTTGLQPQDYDEIRSLIEEEGSESNVFVAPNFAIGAVLMMRFAAQASRFFPMVEIIELHHDGKADAPSGTALRTAHEVAAARGAEPKPAVESVESVGGARGGAVEGIHIHSVRLPGLVAHQEVLLGGPGQSLTIRHDSYDRASFMPGVMLAVKQINRHPGLTVGLENLLDL